MHFHLHICKDTQIHPHKQLNMYKNTIPLTGKAVNIIVIVQYTCINVDVYLDSDVPLNAPAYENENTSLNKALHFSVHIFILSLHRKFIT